MRKNEKHFKSGNQGYYKKTWQNALIFRMFQLNQLLISLAHKTKKKKLIIRQSSSFESMPERRISFIVLLGHPRIISGYYCTTHYAIFASYFVSFNSLFTIHSAARSLQWNYNKPLAAWMRLCIITELQAINKDIHTYTETWIKHIRPDLSTQITTPSFAPCFQLRKRNPVAFPRGKFVQLKCKT